MVHLHKEYYDPDTHHGQTKTGPGWPCRDKTHVLNSKYGSQKYGFTEEDRVAKRNGTCAKRKHTECFKREYLAPKVIRNSLPYKNTCHISFRNKA